MKGVPSPLVRLSEGLNENHSKTFTRGIKILKYLNFSNAKVIQSIVSGSRKHKSEMEMKTKWQMKWKMKRN